jgi:hypothetical protein
MAKSRSSPVGILFTAIAMSLGPLPPRLKGWTSLLARRSMLLSRRRTFGAQGGPRMKLFYTGPVINTEMLVTMLEKHGIPATQEIAAGESDDENDLSRAAHVFVPEAEYDRAHRLFYADREDEL